MNLFTTISAIVPIFFVLVLGYLAGRHHRFDSDQTSGFNALALDYALPASLLVSMAQLPRKELFAEGPLLLVLVVVLGGGFPACYLVASKLAHRSRAEAVLLALAVGSTSTAAYGPAVLGALFPHQPAVLVPLVALSTNVVQIPVVLALLDSTTPNDNAPGDGAGAGGAVRTAQHTHVLGDVVLSTLKKRLVWAPLVGLAYSLSGLPIPVAASGSLLLLAQVTSGVALFAAGLILAAHRPVFTRTLIGLVAIRSVVIPAAVVGLVLLLGVNAALGQEATVSFALPTATIVVQLAERYKVLVPEMATVLLLTTVVAFVLLPLLYTLTSPLSG